MNYNQRMFYLCATLTAGDLLLSFYSMQNHMGLIFIAGFISSIIGVAGSLAWYDVAYGSNRE